jgi:hypothetical protein
VGSLLHLQHTVGNRATTQVVQRLKINDCSTTDEGGISDALLQAHTDLSDAIQRILSPGGDHTFLHRVTSFFGTSAWGTVAEGLKSILNGLQAVTIECENPGHLGHSFFCDPRVAYVRWLRYPSDETREIHLCQPAFQALSPARRVHVLVHEAAHRFVPAGGDVYYGLSDCSETGATRGLSDEERIANADCYACLVSGANIGIAPGTPPAATPTGGGS